jgi:hypothetical protein
MTEPSESLAVRRCPRHDPPMVMIETKLGACSHASAGTSRIAEHAGHDHFLQKVD